MFDQNPDFLYRLAKQVEADRLREADLNRLPVARPARARAPLALRRKLALALAGAALMALIAVQLGQAAAMAGAGM